MPIYSKPSLTDSAVDLTSEQLASPAGITPSPGAISLEKGLQASGYLQAPSAANPNPRTYADIPYAPGMEPVKAPGAAENLKNDLANAGIATSAANNLALQAGNLEAEQAAIRSRADSRLANVRAGIVSQFDTKISEARETGEKTVSGYQARLGESRGLGFSSSRANFIDHKKAENQKYLDSLERVEQELLDKADIDSADRISAEIKEARDYNFKLHQASREEQYKFLAEQRAQGSFEQSKKNQDRDDATRMLDQMAKSGGTLDTSTIAKFDTLFGTPGYSQTYLDTTKAATRIKTASDLADFKLKLIPLADKIPVGTSVPITLPDGSVYKLQGTQEEKHSQQYTEWQDYKKTGGKLNFPEYQTLDANQKATRINVAAQEKAKNKELIPGINAMIAGENMLGKDGKVSPADWAKLRGEWVNRNGDVRDFDAQFGGLVNSEYNTSGEYFTTVGGK